jgi:hypothetical protein
MSLMGKRQIIASCVGCRGAARSSIALSGGRGVNRILLTVFRTSCMGMEASLFYDMQKTVVLFVICLRWQQRPVERPLSLSRFIKHGE